MIAALIVAAMSLPVMAQAPKPAPADEDVTITLTQEELNALIGLMDAGVKAEGLKAIPAAAKVIVKLQKALKPAVPAPAPKPEEKK